MHLEIGAIIGRRPHSLAIHPPSGCDPECDISRDELERNVRPLSASMSYLEKIHSRSLESLLEERGTPRISIHLPMERRGPETRKNPIELKNALKRARELLAAQGTDEKTIDACLERAESLLDDVEFWRHQESSLTLFMSPDSFHSFVLDVPVKPWVGVSDQYAVLPVLAALDRRTRAFVLVLGENAVRLFRWRMGELEPLEVPGLPENLDAALQLDPEPSVQQHPVTRGGGRGVVEGTHGQGMGKDQSPAYRKEFFQRVDEAVSRHLATQSAPLLLASVRENRALYQKINTYPHFAEDFLEGSFEHTSEAQLEAALAARLSERYDRQVTASMRSLREVEGEGLVADSVDEMVRAANEGRVRRLYISWPPPAITGEWKADRNRAELDERVDPRRVDLLDLAAVETWRQGGEVRPVSADRWSRESPCFAELRWKDGSE